MRCAPGKSATGHLSFEEADKYAIISYKFQNEGCMIEPSKKSRLYPSVREQLKREIEQGKPPKKVTHEVLKKRGGTTNAPSASHIPTINQSYDKNTKLLPTLLKNSSKSNKEMKRQRIRLHNEYKQILLHMI